MGTLIGLAVTAVILAAMIRASLRAKPLAGKQYRWGTFIGISQAMNIFLFFYMNYNLFPNLRLFSLAVSCCSGISSYGILHRRQYGVVMYALVSLLIVLFSILSSGLNLGTIASIVLPISISVATLIYFGKRWGLLASQPLVRPEAEMENSK